MWSNGCSCFKCCGITAVLVAALVSLLHQLGCSVQTEGLDPQAFSSAAVAVCYHAAPLGFFYSDFGTDPARAAVDPKTGRLFSAAERSLLAGSKFDGAGFFRRFGYAAVKADFVLAAVKRRHGSASSDCAAQVWSEARECVHLGGLYDRLPFIIAALMVGVA